MKRVLGLIIGLVATLGFAGSAAADYPVGTPTVTTSSSSPTAGSSVTLTASGFCANATVVFYTGSTTLGQATSNASGTASIAITAPAAGTYMITAASSGNCVASASLTLTVASSGGNIPATGSDSTVSGLQLGGIAVAAGAALMAVVGLKRRRPAVA